MNLARRHRPTLPIVASELFWKYSVHPPKNHSEGLLNFDISAGWIDSERLGNAPMNLMSMFCLAVNLQRVRQPWEADSDGMSVCKIGSMGH